MANYKVIQDIEAEDKLLGPLSLRQFIYAVIVVVLGFIGFKLITVKWFLTIPLIPPMIFFGLLAAPISQNQPSEVWLLAKIRFFLKPRLRIWDQSGIKELVTVTVPKKIEAHYTKGFSEDEVTSRLKALSATLDTRGWAIKNVSSDVYANRFTSAGADSDRLLQISAAPQPVVVGVNAADDILDEQNNPVAQHMQQMITQQEQAHKQELRSQVQNATSPKPTSPFSPPPASDITLEQEAAFLHKVHDSSSQSHLAYRHMRTINPPGTKPTPGRPHMTSAKDPDILSLAKDNDKSVATIARQAQKNRQQPSDGEVVVPLR